MLAALRQAREASAALFLFGTIVAAVAEELFFRGYLFRRKLRARPAPR